MLTIFIKNYMYIYIYIHILKSINIYEKKKKKPSAPRRLRGVAQDPWKSAISRGIYIV